MSFHTRKYYHEHEEYFPADDLWEFERYLDLKDHFIIINAHLINYPEFGKFDLQDNRYSSTDFNGRKTIIRFQEKNMKKKEFKKWAFFLCNIKNDKNTARQWHQENEKNEKITWSHAKTNTMKLFFNDRDEEFREIPENEEQLKKIKDPEKRKKLTENAEKFNKFTNFIKQMSNKKRQFDKLIQDFHFTHSLTTDIFNLSPNTEARDGEIVTGCMVVNQFYGDNMDDLKNDDTEVFSGLFSNQKSIIFAGESSDKRNQIVTGFDFYEFTTKMKRKIKETKNISAFGWS